MGSPIPISPCRPPSRVDQGRGINMHVVLHHAGKPTVISSQLNAIDGLEYKNDSNSTQKFPKGKEVSTKRSTSLEHRWGAKLEMEYEYNAKWTAGVPAVDQAEITSKFK